jgi:hypothetical protein
LAALCQPVWSDIRQTRTLQFRGGRDEKDEVHISPLQLDVIERCHRTLEQPRRYRPNPLLGIGSEVFCAVEMGRKGIGIELKPSYFKSGRQKPRRLRNPPARPIRRSRMNCACGKSLPATNKGGMCRSCAAKRLNSDPEIVARRKAAIQRYFTVPGVREAHAARLRHYLANMPEDHRQRRSERAMAVFERFLKTPEAQERGRIARLDPDYRKRRGLSVSRSRLPWCPVDLIPLYQDLTRKGMLAADAREVMQSMIPGTVEHARRSVANAETVMLIKRERDIASRY